MHCRRFDHSCRRFGVSPFLLSPFRLVAVMTCIQIMLVKKQSRLDVIKYSFSQRTINVWNKISTDCVHASSVNMFKNNIQFNSIQFSFIYRHTYTLAMHNTEVQSKILDSKNK